MENLSTCCSFSFRQDNWENRDTICGYRLIYNSYEQKCGMITERLMKTLFELDSVHSNNNENVQYRKKSLTDHINVLLDRSEKHYVNHFFSVFNV